MTDMILAEYACTQCGRPIDGDDDDLCEFCLHELEEVIQHRFRPRDTSDRDGKRLEKARRPKHKPGSERDRMLPEPPRPPQPPRGGVRNHPVKRPQRPAVGRPEGRR